ncbi:protein ZAR1-like [Mus musculus]|uniref:Protein ZAR1-like n=1 Tax=Mus musculus TaxID=10090 RepID=ZAR1L_MOUSE|nr:protein ZAR1-like [Mus musculus]C3VD30.1 RecName: Full=Protein ZAR1-like; AltName: Full=Zygote arrest protein 1-like; AltName: Full=Zygote arrest protein 2 [Mus musculus]ACO82078.1 zygotic arrest 2 [Mus musculus]|eukprot:NP_001153165.1 ZAR1-like protein [Mus musculus]
MERLFCVPCGYGTTDPLTYPGPWRHCQQQNWPQNMGAPIFLARLRVPANVSQSCMNPYNRAQLQAVSTQMDPNLSLWLRSVHTTEVGVQVSLRVDKSVQCSQGSQTLHSSSLSDRTSSRKPTEAWEVGRRALIRRPQDGEDEESQEELTGPTEASQLLLPTWSRDREEQFPRLKELGEEYAHSPQDRKGKQFLELKYGYFHCKDCKRRWESAYVWCISGTNKVYFKQLCNKCQKSFNPYRVEEIQCQTCLRVCCSCSPKKRHIDVRRPHRQELCGHCKDKKFSCSVFFSLK